MKKLIYAAVGLAVVFATSCKKDIDGNDDQKPLIIGSSVDTLVGEITVNTTVTRETYLKGIVFVKPGVTLTVNAGVTIKGSLGGAVPDLINFENNKGTLIVEKGGILNAVGTPTAPVIWTSPNPAGSRGVGDWGGIVILGNAPIINKDGGTTNTYEAFRTATPDPRFSYGGTNATENSGTIAYNRIDFAGGVVLLPNQEVNGLTFGGVGSGTTVHHVEVSNNGDDGFEFFGGTVNADHLISYSNRDDDFDFDEAYNGRLQFIIAYRTDLADVSGSEFIESDNNSLAIDYGLNTTPFIANATFIGPTSLVTRGGIGSFDGGIYVRRQSRIRFANSLVAGQVLPSVIASTPTTDASLLLPTSDPDASPIVFNIFESQSTTPVVKDANESNPIGTVVNTPLYNYLASPANGNSAVPNYAGFKLDGTLKPLSGSPALSGGINLSSYGFVGTTQRGAVLTTDVWTAQPWITTALN
jgi:hypothetical protein